MLGRRRRSERGRQQRATIGQQRNASSSFAPGSPKNPLDQHLHPGAPTVEGGGVAHEHTRLPAPVSTASLVTVHRGRLLLRWARPPLAVTKHALLGAISGSGHDFCRKRAENAPSLRKLHPERGLVDGQSRLWTANQVVDGQSANDRPPATHPGSARTPTMPRQQTHQLLAQSQSIVALHTWQRRHRSSLRGRAAVPS